MEKVIATIVIIVLTMGLISYAIVGQMSGFRDTADTITQEENRLEAMLKDSSLVPFSTVKKYITKGEKEGYEILVDGENVDSEEQLSKYNEKNLFSIKKTYDEFGEISVVEFNLK